MNEFSLVSLLKCVCSLWNQCLRIVQTWASKAQQVFIRRFEWRCQAAVDGLEEEIETAGLVLFTQYMLPSSDDGQKALVSNIAWVAVEARVGLGWVL